jgi:hypothetical protein
MLLISALVTLVGSFLGFCVDYLFDILSAPTADAAKIEALERLQQTTASENLPPQETSNRRRQSLVIVSPASDSQSRRRSTSVTPFVADIEARVVPSEFITAHRNAITSFQGIMTERRGLVDQNCESWKLRRMSRVPLSSSSSPETSISRFQSQDLREVSRTNVLETKERLDDDVDSLFQSLILEIGLEREGLQGQDRETFVAEWGFVGTNPILDSLYL